MSTVSVSVTVSVKRERDSLRVKEPHSYLFGTLAAVLVAR